MSELYTVTFDHYVDGKCCVYKMNGDRYLLQKPIGDKPPLMIINDDVCQAVRLALHCGGKNIEVNCVGENE